MKNAVLFALAAALLAACATGPETTTAEQKPSAQKCEMRTGSNLCRRD